MRLSHSLISAVAVASFLALWSGCAYMNNGSLDDLIPEPSQTLNDQSLNDQSYLSDLKLDPMADSLARQIEKSERELTRTDSEPSATNEKHERESTKFPTPDFPIEKSEALLPINNSLRNKTIRAEPIVLQAANKATVPAPSDKAEKRSQSGSDASSDDSPIAATSELTADQIMSETRSKKKTESLSDGGRRATNLLTPSHQTEHPLLPVPVSEPPRDSSSKTGHGDELVNNPSSNDGPSVDSLEDFENYVSYEMQFLTPPFPMHPDLGVQTEDNSNVIHGSLEVPPSPTKKAEAPQPNSPHTQLEQLKEVEKNTFPKPQSMQTLQDHNKGQQNNYFVGNRIQSEEKESQIPPFETQSAELPAKLHESIANPKTDLATAPRAEGAHTKNTVSSEKITWQSQLDRTIDVFESEFETTVDNAEAENLESGLVMLKALKQNMRPDSGSPEELRKYWSHQIQAINDLLNGRSTGEDSRVAAVALEELRLAVQHLQVVADLKVFNAMICKSVSGYGQYTTFSNNEFVPHQTILVYCEIDNFAPLLETNNEITSYQTRLSSSFTVRDGQGTVVQHQDFPVVTDRARNLRRDFFMHLPVTFTELEPGSYELQLTVRDHGSDKSAELDRSLKFTIR